MIGPSSVMSRAARVELQWVKQAQAGDRTAFDRLVQRHFPRIYSIGFRLVGNHEDAEDLAQECFVRAWRSLSFFRTDRRFSAWLVRIALHLSHDHHRRRGRRAESVPLGELSELAEPEDRSAAGPAQTSSRRELQRDLARAIEALPATLRVALVLRVLEGLSYDEIAEATGRRPGTVRTQVMKARRWLVRMLGADLEGGTR
ncbi:MAG: RNA polymerase sigma-70 factor (ECF subfamily) [Chlamydiales bacterium]|jgi:RNA polymerase sigma-70 factor (ECF subfamily)